MNALHLYPVLYLNVAGALANVDPAWRRRRRIWAAQASEIPPHHASADHAGNLAGGTVVFIWAFTELGVPLMFRLHAGDLGADSRRVKDIGGNPSRSRWWWSCSDRRFLLYAAGKFSSDAIPCVMSKATSQGGPRQADRVVGGSCRRHFSPSPPRILPTSGWCGRLLTDWYQTVLPSGWTSAHFRRRWVTTSRFHPSGTVSSTRVWPRADLFLGVAIVMS